MGNYLYGIIPEGEKAEFGPIGFQGGEVKAIPCQDYAVVIGLTPKESFSGITKEELVGLLLSHQKTLETVMKGSFVLPFKFGTVVRNETEFQRAFDKGKTFLKKICDQIKGCAEVDVVATWNVQEILQEISKKESDIIRLQEAIQTQQKSGAKDRARIGMLLACALKIRAETWRNQIINELKPHTQAYADHDLMNDEMVCNASFLIQKRNEDPFFQKVEEIDQAFEGKLNFKCVGPLPPYSFATVTLKRFKPKEVRSAANLLGINGSAEMDQVKKIYKKLSAKVHPDTNPNLQTEEFNRLNKAYELVADYLQEGRQSFNEDAIATYVRLECEGYYKAQSAVEGEAPVAFATGGGDASPYNR